MAKTTGAPRFLITHNQAADNDAAFIVYTRKPGLVFEMLAFPDQDTLSTYLSSLPEATLHRVYTQPDWAAQRPLPVTTRTGDVGVHLVFIIVQIINKEDLDERKVDFLLKRVQEWFVHTQLRPPGTKSCLILQLFTGKPLVPGPER